MADLSPQPGELPQATAAPKSRGPLLLVWLVPLIAVLIGGWLAVKTILEQGPTIAIVFKSAEGLEAGKTKLRYKDVEIGKVTKVDLAEDLKKVIVTAELTRNFTRHLVEDTNFWVVRARVSGGSVTGLGTLLSGSYIGVDVGKSARSERKFTGLDTPPVIQIDTPGREFTLRSDDLGSLDIGSPILYRRMQVGQIKSHALSPDGKGVVFTAFIHAPYDRFVTTNARFWNASGVNLSFDAAGIKLDTQSVASILVGGVAFEEPPGEETWPAAEPAREFNLFATRTAAMKNPETKIFKLSMSFRESVRGLAIGAPVDFRGIEVGEVVALHASIDPVSQQTLVVVDTHLYPERMRALARDKSKAAANSPKQLDLLVEKGLRGKLQTGNLLTGQLYVALDFVPAAPKARVDWSQSPPVLPTVASSLQSLQQTIESIARKIDQLPMERIGKDLDQTLVSANALMTRIEGDLAPEAAATMRELTRTAQTFRILADYLERHPEALLRGKPEDEK